MVIVGEVGGHFKKKERQIKEGYAHSQNTWHFYVLLTLFILRANTQRKDNNFVHKFVTLLDRLILVCFN
jgi:hypothetical protein